MPKKVALFVDVENLQHQLRTQHNRSLDPALVVAEARSLGDVVASAAIADWADLSPELKAGFEAQSVTTVQVERVTRSRDHGGRRREVARDLVDLEMLARAIEVLFPQAGGPEVDVFVLGSTDDVAARCAGLIRERFQKEVVVLGVESATGEALRAAATAWRPLPMPPVQPTDLEGLSKLIPMLEELERKKRYLNFKYIRETVVRRLDLPERSFDAAERLLAEAIGSGVLAKLKIEDKYNPGQQFTAYALDRSNALFKTYGSGEPAPIHDEPPRPEGELDGAPAVAPVAADRPGPAAGAPPIDDLAVYAPTMARSGRAPRGDAGRARDPRDGRSDGPRDGERRDAGRGPRDGRRDERDLAPAARQQPYRDGPRDDEPEAGPDDLERGPPVDLLDDRGDDRGRRPRRRRRRGGGGGEPSGGPVPAGRGRDVRGRPAAGPPQDRVAPRYEAPSRFLSEDEPLPLVADEDIDEDRILRAARGDRE